MRGYTIGAQQTGCPVEVYAAHCMWLPSTVHVAPGIVGHLPGSDLLDVGEDFAVQHLILASPISSSCFHAAE